MSSKWNIIDLRWLLTHAFICCLPTLNIVAPSETIETFDYEQKYDEDEYCKEMAPNARFWRVYLDEAHIYDAEMIEGWRDTLDVLLVFVRSFFCYVAPS